MTDKVVPDNGRVTLALLQRDVHEVCEEVVAMRADFAKFVERLDGRVSSLERDQATLVERVEGQGRDIGALKSESRTWSTINSLFAAAATAIAAIFHQQP